MTDDAIDRCLSEDEQIAPSSGFVAGVMSAIQQEAEPAPIAFPWWRALPGFAAFAIASVGCILDVFLSIASAPASQTASALATWIGIILIVACGFSALALRLQRHSSLFAKG